jgi:hypothetical protein
VEIQLPVSRARVGLPAQVSRNKIKDAFAEESFACLVVILFPPDAFLVKLLHIFLGFFFLLARAF